MNLDELQHKLIGAAKAHPPSDRVPYAFERRILQRLKALHAADAYAFWAGALWRAAAPCVAIALLLTAWSILNSSGAPAGSDLSQEFEKTVMAAANVDQPAVEMPR